MFKKILIPLDGSYRSEQALDLVGKLFSTDEIELILLEATGEAELSFPIYAAGVDGYMQGLPEYKKARVDEYVTSVTSKTRSWAPNVRGYSMLGKPEDAIVEIANTEEIDLIIMVTHGYAAFERLLLGSVTEKVIRDAPCPVLAVRDGHLPKHMLIALDGSPFSETMLEPAFELARLIQSDVTLARVDLPADDLHLSDVSELRQIDPKLADTLLIHHNSRSEFYLDDIRKRFMDSLDEGVEIKVDYDVDYGKPGVRLPAIAERQGCDLIAMATHGRKGMQRFFKRSVTEDVMHHTETAMFVLHPAIKSMA
ncbi:MAG: universal stress protein [Anaerolineae bacterium]